MSSSVGVVAAMLVLSVASERIVVQLGPRSWYTASTPTVVLAALLGGPLVGVTAGIATQIARTEAVWRRRLAEGGLAAIQGLAAGVIGLNGWSTGGGATAVAAVAMATAVGVNSVGRALVLVDRQATPLGQAWVRGFVVDCVEMVLIIPLFGVLLVASKANAALVVMTMAALLAVLAIAKRNGESTTTALMTEQANARLDLLTGAPNRRSFEESLAAEHARVVRGGLPAGLFMVDIDEFKSINDHHGHRVGDDVLIAIVRRLTEGLRPGDIVARWGGDEITVLVSGVCPGRQLEQIGERIRALVGELPIMTTPAVVPVTVSVGATLLDGSIPPHAALNRADHALYGAKQTRDATAVSVAPRLTFELEYA